MDLFAENMSVPAGYCQQANRGLLGSFFSFAEVLNKFMFLAPSASPGESFSFAPVDSGVEEAGDAILPDAGGALACGLPKTLPVKSSDACIQPPARFQREDANNVLVPRPHYLDNIHPDLADKARRFGLDSF